MKASSYDSPSSTTVVTAEESMDIMKTFIFPSGEGINESTSSRQTNNTNLKSTSEQSKSWLSLDEDLLLEGEIELFSRKAERLPAPTASPPLPPTRLSDAELSITPLFHSRDRKHSEIKPLIPISLPTTNPSYEISYFLRNSGPPEKKAVDPREPWNLIKTSSVIKRFSVRYVL